MAQEMTVRAKEIRDVEVRFFPPSLFPFLPFLFFFLPSKDVTRVNVKV
jgi:hypothetical protein